MAKGGYRPGAGRKRGSITAATQVARDIAARVLTDKNETALWRKYLAHKDPHIAWAAFQLLKQYKSGKPVQPISGDGGPLRIEIVNRIERPER